MDNNTPFISVASPAYNEEGIIESVVLEWRRKLDELGLEAEIVVCNDGSSDSTPAKLDALAKSVKGMRVVHSPRNMGYGHALTSAIAACKGRYVATIDSDGQFDLGDIKGFLEVLRTGQHDGVTGYRVKKEDSLPRVLADRCLNLIVRIGFGTGLRDTNCALKVMDRERLQSLKLESPGFSLPTEICLKMEATGQRLAEAPVGHADRKVGKSKLKVWRTGTRMLIFLLYLRLRLSLHKRKILLYA